MHDPQLLILSPSWPSSPLLLRHNNHCGVSHLSPVSPLRSLSSLLPTLGSVAPKWRFEAPSESVSFESAAAAERRPLSVTERAETRRHGQVTARSRRFNQYQIERRESTGIFEPTPATQKFSKISLRLKNVILLSHMTL